jgi:hypothetical protein
MFGYADRNEGVFKAVQRSLETRGYSVISPWQAEAENPTPGRAQSWDWYMRKCIMLLLQCEGVAVLPDWECSAGARLEVQIAQALKIPVKPYAAWGGRG